MKHGSLFSGIGGAELAAEWAGWDNVFHCEINPFGRKVLDYYWPNAISYSDIHNVTVDNYGNLLYLCENGDIKMGAKKLSKYDNAIQLYESGMSIGECAEFYEISRQAMHKILIRRNCEFRSQKKHGKENHFYRGSMPDNSKKIRVQHLTDKAIKKGVLIQPVKCSICDGIQEFKDGRNGIQAHHSDYDKPLDVIWMCQKCHHKWHSKNKAINQYDTEKEKEPTGAIDVLSGGFP